MEILPIIGKPRTTTQEPETSKTSFGDFRKSRKIDRLFILAVVLPVTLAVLYFGFLATDVYVSESRFVIRNPEKPATSALGTILSGAGFTAGSEESFAAQSFATSRDGLRAVNRNGEFRRAYSRPDIFVLDRFDPSGR